LFDISGSCDVIGHVTIRLAIGHLLTIGWSYGTKPLSLTVSETFNGLCEAMIDMTINDLYTQVKVIHFGTNRFLVFTTSYRLGAN